MTPIEILTFSRSAVGISAEAVNNTPDFVRTLFFYDTRLNILNNISNDVLWDVCEHKIREGEAAE